MATIVSFLGDTVSSVKTQSDELEARDAIASLKMIALAVAAISTVLFAFYPGIFTALLALTTISIGYDLCQIGSNMIEIWNDADVENHPFDDYKSAAEHFSKNTLILRLLVT